MSDMRGNLISVFEDTMQWLQTDTVLKQAVANSQKNTKLYMAEEYPQLPAIVNPMDTEIQVSSDKSFQAAMRLAKIYPEAKIVVHNFASATNPGGGVANGSRAQEECLCRCSTLYPCLRQQRLLNDFYNFHRSRHDVRYTDACIYSPDVYIIKTDEALPRRMPEREWCKVDILTCAAPNLRSKPYNRMNPGTGMAVTVSDTELAELHVSRAKHMLTVAAANHADILVLGAFGCGAFCNNPNVVAKAYRKVLQQPEFQNRFRHITFAVFDTSRDAKNYHAFCKVFS